MTAYRGSRDGSMSSASSSGRCTPRYPLNTRLNWPKTQSERRVKINFTLKQATKSQRGVEVQPYSLFNLGARWGWVVNATPRPLYPRERPGTYCIRGWVGLRVGLDGCGKSRPHLDSIPGLSVSTMCRRQKSLIPAGILTSERPARNLGSIPNERAMVAPF
jgi:hypothetical protein